MHEEVKKKIIKLIGKYNEVTVGLLVRELGINKALAGRVLEEMRNKDGIVEMNYNENFRKAYRMKIELSIEERDNLEALK